MPGKGFHIGHDQRPLLRPARPADTPALTDARTGHRALKRTDYQLPVFDQVKAHPQPAELLLQRRGNIGQIGRAIAFTLHQGPDLREQSHILLCFAAPRYL